jgi:hypothetical protein
VLEFGVHGPKEVQALIKEAERPFDVEFQGIYDEAAYIGADEAAYIALVADEKANRKACCCRCWGNTQGKANRTPLSVALVSGERMQHTDAGWEFLGLQDEEIKEVGQAMYANNISLFIEGVEDQVSPSMLLKDLDPNKPLFALPDTEAAARLRRHNYMTRQQQAAKGKIDRARRRRQQRHELCDAMKCGPRLTFGPRLGPLVYVSVCLGPLAWLVMGIWCVVDAWGSYRSGELEGTCPSSHLYEACLTELAFAGFGVLLFLTTWKCHSTCDRTPGSARLCARNFGRRPFWCWEGNVFAFFAFLAWLWTVVETGIARSQCPSIGESNLWFWAIVTVIGEILGYRRVQKETTDMMTWKQDMHLQRKKRESWANTTCGSIHPELGEYYAREHGHGKQEAEEV